jgi:hypothetical protein
VFLAAAYRGIGTSRRNQHLHREEFGEHEVFVRGITRFPASWEMNCANRVASLALSQIARRQSFQSGVSGRKFVQQPVNHASQDTLRKTFRRRVDRRDSTKMDRDLLVILDDFELWMVHANSFSA